MLYWKYQLVQVEACGDNVKAHERVLTISLRGFVAELHIFGVVLLEWYAGYVVPALPGVQQPLVAPGVGHDIRQLWKGKKWDPNKPQGRAKAARFPRTIERRWFSTFLVLPQQEKARDDALFKRLALSYDARSIT